jgi:hypothetical protein
MSDTQPQLYKKGETGNPYGRPKGIPDWRTKYYNTRETLARLKHDPVEEIVKLAKNEDADEKLRFLANKELMARIAPVLKAITIETDGEGIEQLKKDLRESLASSLEQFKKEY